MTAKEYEKIYQDFIQEIKAYFEELPRRAEINAIISNFSPTDISGTILTKKVDVFPEEGKLPLDENLNREIACLEGEVTDIAIGGIIITNIKPIITGLMSAGIEIQLEELNFLASNFPEQDIELIELFICQKSNQMTAEYLSSFVEMNKDNQGLLKYPDIDPYVINSYFIGEIFGKDYSKYYLKKYL